ncbi:FAD/NAD(P)-binding protein [Asaia siamensis]
MTGIHDIAIIGGGASATLLAWNLRQHHGRSCVVIDPTDQPALGLAYGTRSVENLLNVPASGMSALADKPGHFLDWLRQKIDPQIDSQAFIPRAIYGLYLQDLFRQARPLHLRARVTRLTCDADSTTLHLDARTSGERRCLRARHVVLALGHFAPPLLPGIPTELAGAGRYYHQVWAQNALEAIAPEDPVLLIGSGLTAIDQIMQLRAAGHSGKITVISRHARFPQRHAPAPVLSAPVIEPGQCAPRCTAYLHRLNAALKQGIPWRACIDSLRPVTNDLWAALPPDERARFRRHLQRRWDVVRHRMAPRIAEALDVELANGSLSLRAGHLQKITTVADGLCVTLRRGAQLEHVTVAHVLNCTGPNLRYDRVDSPLLRDLLDIKLARSGQGGIGLDTTRDGRVIAADGTAWLPLHTLGPARQGTLFESIAIPEIRGQAYDLAMTLDGLLSGASPQDLCA